MSLLAVISQVLMPGKAGPAVGEDGADPSRVAGFEVTAMTPAVANLIRNNEVSRIQDVIQTSRDSGRFTLDGYLHDLVRKGLIDSDVALA